MSLALAPEAPARAAPRLAPLTAALDVGVSKIVCLAARRDAVLEMHPGRPLRVLGVGVQTPPAVASGKPGDFDACARAIHVAVQEASFMAGADIERLTVAYGGPGVAARIVRASVKVRARKIDHRDLEAVLDAAERAGLGARQTMLHCEPLRYVVDDKTTTADPLGMSARTLKVEACIVSAPAQAIEALRACVAAAGCVADEVIAAPFAVGCAALTPEEREEGALVLDLGAGALGLSVFAAEGLVHAETIALGGARLTRELARTLGTSFAAAERVKLAYGVIGEGFDPSERIAAPRLGVDGRLEAAAAMRGAIAEVLAPRMHETLLTARARLAKAGFSGAAGPSRAVLVGGGALLPGVREAAEAALGVSVRIGRLFDLSGFDQGEAGPGFAAAAGALRWRLDNPTPEDVSGFAAPSLREAAAALRSAAGRAWGWLAENF